MALEISEEDFRKQLKRVISPSVPISTPELLLGRQKHLQTISRAFNNPGRHIFVYGDRGVGKTSLAQTAAIIEQSSDSDPIIVGCDNNSTFNRLSRDIFKRCLPTGMLFAESTETRKVGGTFQFLSAENQQGLSRGVIPEIQSVNEAIDIARYVCEFHSESPVIIIDEFDQISDAQERTLFAQFLKQLSDQRIPIKFIMCGIGGSVEALLGAHLSTDRLLTPIQLDRLSMDSIWQVLLDAARPFGVEVPKVMYTRIAQICDGFPYYVHLIAEHLLWAAFDAEHHISVVSESEYHQGLSGAIADSQNALKQSYEVAIRKYNDDREEVLWAFADSNWLRVQIKDAFQRYNEIMDQRPDRQRVSKTTFYNRVAGLKSDSAGNILVGEGSGWYHFKENVVRGYVRLRAEKKDIQLGLDHI